MKIILSGLVLLILLSCTGGENRVGGSLSKSQQAMGNETFPGERVISKPSLVSAEVSYTPQKNLINLSIEESEGIVKKLLVKRDEEIRKYNNTGSLIQGEWKVLYNPPKYPDEYDAIVVTMSGKTYNLPGVYGKEERTRYFKHIGAGTGCVSYIQGLNPEQGTPNVLINGTYYYPPNHGDCMSGVRTFGYFDSFSPSGNYLIYQTYGWEFSETRIVDIQTGRELFSPDGGGSGIQKITWTPDRKQMLFSVESGFGGTMESGLYITKRGDFPKYEKIQDDRGMISFDIDEKYIYVLEEYSDYYFRILDRSTYSEVYARIVKK